jgi:murein L,D-transpeptidase YcbB/YkuD
MVADARITDAAISFFHHIAIGGEQPPVAYEGLRYVPDCLDVTGLLALSAGNGKLEQLPAALEPVTDDYKALSKLLRELLSARDDTSRSAGYRSVLLAKLRAAGVIPYALHEPDPVKLRVLLSGRINELNEALNTVRWARCLQLDECILVNIPSASLQYYVQGKLVLQSRVVVGKRSTPTGTLSSEVNEVVLYPYWTVPAKIASKELLPLIKRNASFLNDNGYQVISGGQIIDPASINWKQYNASRFPFTLRQSTGCDNSLGIIKLSFNSPYGIYLHDTPWKSLFNLPARYMSHGCVRVERVMELSNLLLRDDSITLKEVVQKGDSLNTHPTPLRLAQPVPLVVVYHTAWPDTTGTVRFYNDIYQKNNTKH